MRWVLHIGAPKTGSTAIQRFLFENRKALLDHGVQYPDVSLRGYGHHDLAFLLNGAYPKWATTQPRSLSDLGADLAETVKAGNADTVVLSSENFYLYPRPVEFHQLLLASGMRATDQVSIVCYVRRQDQACASWYNQTVKAQGNSDSFEMSLRRDRGLWDYAARLGPWRAEFGPSAVLVRDYEPFTIPPADVRTDFLDVIGAPRGAFNTSGARTNERINRDILDLQRAINRLPLPPSQKRRFHRRLIALTASTADSGTFNDDPLLSPAQRDALVQSYATSNREVARTFLGRAELFDPVSADEPSAAPWTRRGLTPAKIAVILKFLLAPAAPPP